MDVLNIQTKLKNLGYDPGPLDGDLGPKTYRALLDYTVGRNLGATSILLGRAMASEFPKHAITTPLRIAHFLAQAAHETGGFKYFTELGSGDRDGDGYDDYLIRYDRRVDLGNTPEVDGDGQKYRGRGIFQTTGATNYKRAAQRLGVDLVNHPERLAEPELAVASACLYWSDRKLAEQADRDDARAVTKRINGGYNGFEDRLRYLTKLKKILL